MYICLRENANHFEQKKTVLRIKSRNTETMDNRFQHICPGRSSGLQIILAKGRAFPSAEVRTVASCDRKVPAHSAGPTLRILTVFPFHHEKNIHGTRTKFFRTIFLTIAMIKLQRKFSI
jgi:hypothetical protein